MAVTAYAYGQFAKSLINKEIDLDTDTLKLMLCTSAYTPNKDTHQYKSSVTNEVVGTGYTAGGATLTGVSVTYDTATDTIIFDANDVSWLNSTITARWAVLYDASPATDATRPLIALVDLDGDKISSNAEFKVTWNTSGILGFQAA
ncbi:hypothetical protein PBI_KAMPE_38 [Gordonia phage Kampe]|uniref:Uncharacterized protein n=3 Tax=Gordonia phage Orchid TaxID=1838075 RepID=A0A160DHB7_9CAUD|nr:hypothetical protein BH761_gp037 [Gordonia phage Orchid]ANA87272.1 hypothetical protein PBI_PATRICKSTAR_38 [Gordonia phage PatrickStar]ANA87384.1 hypothetical protein PBI_ORCHID_37 [Gordonia phage Orchid]ANA87499.1 hypothetical protein PBI_KAMPE_38 [Gordonia phage Kampe]